VGVLELEQEHKEYNDNHVEVEQAMVAMVQEHV
jgi:hypothetical protein